MLGGLTVQWWLLKTEPGEYCYQDLVRDGKTKWDGVRNYQAQNNMRQMALGDQALIYHSVGPKTVVGVAKVVKAAYPDPAEPKDSKWILIDVAPVGALAEPVGLHTIKADPKLNTIALVRQSRLSVMPLARVEFDRIISLGGGLIRLQNAAK
jgi:predicted RNA-binding protein with PUA-like domain